MLFIFITKILINIQKIYTINKYKYNNKYIIYNKYSYGHISLNI